MAREHVLQPFLLDHVERRLQAVEERDRRRAAEAHLPAVFHHRAPVPVAARVARRQGDLPGTSVDRRKRHPRRHHQALLRAADHQVHAPLVHAEVVRGERGDRVHAIERRMLHAVHRRAHLGHRMAHAGRGLVLRDQHRLDRMRLVRGEPLGDRVRIDRAPLGHGHGLDLDAVLARGDRPVLGKIARLAHQHLVAGRKEIRDARVPRAVARGRVGDDEALLRLQHPLQPLQRPVAQRDELRPREIHRRALHRLQHPVRDVGGARMHEELPAPVTPLTLIAVSWIETR